MRTSWRKITEFSGHLGRRWPLQLVKKVFLTSWWTGEYLPRHYHPLNAPEPPQSGVSGSAALESKGFRRAGRGSCRVATAIQFLLESYGFRPQKLQRNDFCSGKWDFPTQKSSRPRRTRRRGRLVFERASALSSSSGFFDSLKDRPQRRGRSFSRSKILNKALFRRAVPPGAEKGREAPEGFRALPGDGKTCAAGVYARTDGCLRRIIRKTFSQSGTSNSAMRRPSEEISRSRPALSIRLRRRFGSR